MTTDIYATAAKVRACIGAASDATRHLRLHGDYPASDMDVRVVCAPGEPDIFHETACNALELLDLVDKATRDQFVIPAPAMDLARAQAITAAICCVKLNGMDLGAPADLALLRKTSLADMVQANVMVVTENARRTRDRQPGVGITHALHADDRLIAAVYAALNYDADDQDECEPLVSIPDGKRPSFLVHIYSKGEE